VVDGTGALELAAVENGTVCEAQVRKGSVLRLRP